MGDGLTLFSWGYEGWGNWTEQLVVAADAVEKARGRGPPVFVDIRARRAVRAEGFRDRAFERRFGPDRYRWIQGLGNKAILGGADRGEFVDGSQTALLLDLALEIQGDKRRAIFFCSCASPNSGCHRHWVAPQLLKVARKRDQPITVVEWPGFESEPEMPPVIQVSEGVFKALLNNTRASVPLGDELPGTPWLALPWWTPVMVECGEKVGWMFGGPAQRRAGGWQLPFLGGAPNPEVGAREIARRRKDFVLLPRAWPAERPAQCAMEWQPDRLPGGNGRDRESRHPNGEPRRAGTRRERVCVRGGTRGCHPATAGGLGRGVRDHPRVRIGYRGVHAPAKRNPRAVHRGEVLQRSGREDRIREWHG